MRHVQRRWTCARAVTGSRQLVVRSGDLIAGTGRSAGDAASSTRSRACLSRRLSSSANQVAISRDRLREFMLAEVAFFAEKQPQSISLRQVVEASTPKRAAKLTLSELPIRFAQRIQQIEDLPNWRQSPEMVEVHGYYTESFCQLRLIDTSTGDLTEFTDVITRLKSQMKGVIPRLATAMRDLQKRERFTESSIDEWLDTFFLSRIGTEMLTSQYMACMKPLEGGARESASRAGIVSHRTDPTNICERAARHAQQLCRQHFKLKQNVVINVEHSGEPFGGSRIQFPYVPQYLFYIMVELLKNSTRATVEACGNPDQFPERPITITVGADPSQIAIRVHDRAGGIPFSVADRVWSYMYSTHGDRSATFMQGGTPLAGYGVGLPLSRLYARYLGGSLHLMSMPGIGTTAYLYLKRVDTEAKETLPSNWRNSSLGSLSDPL